MLKLRDAGIYTWQLHQEGMFILYNRTILQQIQVHTMMKMVLMKMVLKMLLMKMMQTLMRTSIRYIVSFLA
ncbi:hypothetical protein RchiOBHm_Chr5g0042521 [Rosa chinensis]|uniref:Uncharacterized protein n=1 Tax=Rosa chinensis TaxID=74649 RepID=A0A2P6QD43_ROSCH|nr:hypothetical protein RchiOBHm_Chr5g0042521 [Rosa chinensis]